MKTALEQLESWIEQFYKINGTPTLDDIKGQISLLKDYETEQLAIPRVSQQRELLLQAYKDGFQAATDSIIGANEMVKNKTLQ